LKAEVLDVLKECSDLVKTRNLVAHNPLSMAEYFDEEGMPKYEPLIRSLRNEGNHLTEGHLIKGINATGNVIEKLSKIISDQRLQSWREP
jgi:L-2-hydroxyglutarate oxidase LhgO